jgi:hypothetical protein
VENQYLSDTASLVLQLAKTLPYKNYESSLFNDNLFNKPELFRQLKALGISACGTTRKDVTTLVFGDSLDTWKPAWDYSGRRLTTQQIRMWMQRLFRYGKTVP